ncbi:threonylcarbamoyl-AMP synthase [Nonlabens sp. SCSIO 43208]|uniref:L-threonylcarbamoyladenylate synthase n=1 Tax=Nonlabens TaxID=363408 RepID=UPI0030C7D902
MTEVSSNISRAVDLLNQDKLVAIPTETVYGLAGNIYSEKAIKGIFEMKQRPLFNPLIVHIYDVRQVRELTTDFPEKAQKLAQKFWPGSLTLILPKNEKVPNLITANKNSVGIRMPDHSVTLELLAQLEFPLAAPSANPFSRISPTTAQHVKDYFNDKLELVLDGGPCKNGIESTIVGFENEEPVIYRLGSISQEEIEEVIGKVNINNQEKNAPIAPGMVEKHYAPRTKTVLVENVSDYLQANRNLKIGILLHEKIDDEQLAHTVKYLTSTSDIKEAASLLYASLHELDALNLDIIVAQKFPDSGIGKSLNDRLTRATK